MEMYPPLVYIIHIVSTNEQLKKGAIFSHFWSWFNVNFCLFNHILYTYLHITYILYINIISNHLLYAHYTSLPYGTYYTHIMPYTHYHVLYLTSIYTVYTVTINITTIILLSITYNITMIYTTVPTIKTIAK